MRKLPGPYNRKKPDVGRDDSHAMLITARAMCAVFLMIGQGWAQAPDLSGRERARIDERDVRTFTIRVDEGQADRLVDVIRRYSESNDFQQNIESVRDPELGLRYRVQAVRRGLRLVLSNQIRTTGPFDTTRTDRGQKLSYDPTMFRVAVFAARSSEQRAEDEPDAIIAGLARAINSAGGMTVVAAD